VGATQRKKTLRGRRDIGVVSASRLTSNGKPPPWMASRFIHTSVPTETFSREKMVGCYKGFPMWNADRVKAHVLLYMLTYYLECHMRQAWAPMFDGDDPQAAEAARKGIDLSKRTENGSPCRRTDPAHAGHSNARPTADAQTPQSFRGRVVVPSRLYGVSQLS